MKKYFHQKLVRDKIPEIIELNKGKYEAKVMDEKDFEIELKKKLILIKSIFLVANWEIPNLLFSRTLFKRLENREIQ